jgi:hypothetical protein
MLWLKARSLMALGMTTATRNFSAGAGVSSAWAPQALNTSDRTIRTLKNQTDFFIFFSLI